VQDLCDRLADDESEPALTEEMKAELDRRIEQLDRTPELGVPWDGAKARAGARPARSIPVILSPGADHRELAEAAAWYQRQTGRGREADTHSQAKAIDRSVKSTLLSDFCGMRQSFPAGLSPLGRGRQCRCRRPHFS
jgi:putative addiction module component (TIGR02574 family)